MSSSTERSGARIGQIAGILRRWVTRETTGGALLLGAAVLALIWANSPWSEAYHALGAHRLGPEALELRLSVSHWASDGLLVIFFFLVGVELKHDLVVGSLRNVRHAVVPVCAAVGGMAAPALIYATVIAISQDSAASHGWAIPTATDIAFALAVLAVFGRGLPRALRMFLLTLAVVDDLLAIVIIAVFYSSHVRWEMLGGTAAAALAFYLVVRTRRSPWWLLIPIAVVAWWFMQVSGVHATIAGVVLGLCVPAIPRHGEALPRTTVIESAIRPWSSGVVLPVFAFFAAGVTLADTGGTGHLLAQPVVVAIVLGLFLGKFVGVLGTTALVTAFTPLKLADGMSLRSILPVGFVCGMGFTVSLLIAELSFPDGDHTAGAKVAVLIGTLCSAIVGAIALSIASRNYRLSTPPIIADESVITGDEIRELAWDPAVLAELDDDDLPDVDLDYVARLDGVEGFDVETEFIESLNEQRPGRYGPQLEAGEDEDG